ncbi:unnamed protein product [Ambrosiozyma monospora]|uniref:Phosphotransferase n=1 Tax=Ambrosiozyma monospora TaxID=43982 RepID=A0A9W6YUM0_AMBMO|nr:unnamed protein product [Ambrosiozyma monospora]
MVVPTSTLPANLQHQVDKYEKQFSTPTETLNKIVSHFISELDRGNTDGTDPSGIPMNVAWVMDYPDGSETGDYLAIDLGGTNLRVVMVHLLGNHKFTSEQEKYPLPGPIRTTRVKEELFDFIANSLDDFVKKLNPNGIPEGTVYPLGFTFSYPCTQTSIDMGILQRWTKGFDIPGVEGEDCVPMLMKSINKRGTPIKVVALINDTCGTLVASRYTDNMTEMGCIFGTGVNGAYYERVSNISKLEGKLCDDIPKDSPMLINCEYGSFDNGRKVLPRTIYDVEIDNESPRPGQQAFEKMTSGYYLGELLRKVLVSEYKMGNVFPEYEAGAREIEYLTTPYILDASFLSLCEADETPDLRETQMLYKAKLDCLSVVSPLLARR